MTAMASLLATSSSRVAAPPVTVVHGSSTDVLTHWDAG
jgi:hypothetical protein